MSAGRLRRRSKLNSRSRGQSGHVLVSALLVCGIILTSASLMISAACNKELALASGGWTRNAADLARSGVDQLMAALEANGYSVQSILPIDSYDPSSHARLQGSVSLGNDGSISVRATGQVHKAVKTIQVTLVPTENGIPPGSTLVCSGEINLSGNTGHSSLVLGGNAYCSTSELEPENFESGEYKEYRGYPSYMLPTVNESQFEAMIGSLQNVQVVYGNQSISGTVAYSSHTVITGDVYLGNRSTVRVSPNTWLIIEGDLDGHQSGSPSLVVDGCLWVKGDFHAGAPNGDAKGIISGSGVIVISGSAEISFNPQERVSGLRIFILSENPAYLDFKGYSETASIFVYGEGTLEMDVKKSLTIDPGCFISRSGDINISLAAGNSVLTIREGRFDWDGLELPVSQVGPTYVISSWKERFGSGH